MRSMRVRLAAAGLMAYALTAVGAAGCASSSEDDATFVPGAGPARPVATTAPAPSVSGAPVDLRLPPDVHLAFDITPTGDPVKDKIVQDLATGLRAEYKAMFNDRFGTDALPRLYSAGDGRLAWARYVKIKHDSGSVITGTKRYREFDVTIYRNRRSALVTYCEDESEFYAVYRNTRKTLGPATSTFDPTAYTFVRMLMVRNDATGIWRQFRLEGTEGAKQCLPGA